VGVKSETRNVGGLCGKAVVCTTPYVEAGRRSMRASLTAPACPAGVVGSPAHRLVLDAPPRRRRQTPEYNPRATRLALGPGGLGCLARVACSAANAIGMIGARSDPISEPMDIALRAGDPREAAKTGGRQEGVGTGPRPLSFFDTETEFGAQQESSSVLPY